jgi:hypothetical protein
MDGVARLSLRPARITLGVVSGTALLACLASYIAWGRGGSLLGRPQKPLLFLSIAAPLAILGWNTAWSGSYTEPFSRVGWRCLGLTLAFAALPLIATLYLKRSSLLRYSSENGAAIGAALGAWSALGVEMWCPLTNPSHAAFGHVLPVVVLTTLGALFGPLILRMRLRER